MKKILIMFFATSITFGIFNFLFGRDLTASLQLGLIFGTFMTIILGLMNFVLVKSRGGKASSSVVQENEVDLPLSMDHSFQLCKDATTTIIGTKITLEDRDRGIIHAKAPLNISTWGDVIVLELQEINEETTKVRIKSKPIVVTTIIDYGKNLENVNKISNYLKRNSHKQEGSGVDNSEDV